MSIRDGRAKVAPMKRHRLLVALFLVACGSRTGLLIDEIVSGAPVDGGVDAGGDGADAQNLDASKGLDSSPRTDAIVRTDCPDPSTTFVYAVSALNDLISFYPPTNTFKTIGKIDCPIAHSDATPFSMAVDRAGFAYVLFSDGDLFRVSTKTGACAATPYVAGQQGYETFGMGFATRDLGPEETLYIAGNSINPTGSLGLATINTQTFKVDRVGDFTPPLNNAELTGTGDGRLFAFYSAGTAEEPSSGVYIAEINKLSGAVIGSDFIAEVDQGDAWAFAYWGGEFYNFTGNGNGTSRVTKYNPNSHTLTDVAQSNERIVGAGVSTCAPEG